MISVITPALVKDEQGLTWLNEAIASVYDQTFSDKYNGQQPWEMIIVNDHSPVSLEPLKQAWGDDDTAIRWLDAEGQGVSAARNQAARAARGDLLLPLDADDKLAATALASFMAAWDKRGSAGIIYSDVVMFGQDYARVYLAPEYDFVTLLTATYMTVGCLHRKADWEKVGGWKEHMTGGLEDWEYWIAMGEAGVCGKRVAEPLYWYRRHPTGRLAWLKANKELWTNAYHAMREDHLESYNGRYPMGCCGGKKAAAVTGRVVKSEQAIAKEAAAMSDSGLVQMVYRGPRKGDFQIVSGVTRTRYRVPGQGAFIEHAETGRRGVISSDVAWFRSAAQGRDFQVIEPPKPAPAIAPQAVAVPQAASENSEAWKPEIMEEKAADVKPSRKRK